MLFDDGPPDEDHVLGDKEGVTLTPSEPEKVVYLKPAEKGEPPVIVDFYAVLKKGTQVVAWGCDATAREIRANDRFAVTINLWAAPPGSPGLPASSAPEDRPPLLTGLDPDYTHSCIALPEGVAVQTVLLGRYLQGATIVLGENGCTNALPATIGAGSASEVTCTIEADKADHAAGWWTISARRPSQAPGNPSNEFAACPDMMRLEGVFRVYHGLNPQLTSFHVKQGSHHQQDEPPTSIRPEMKDRYFVAQPTLSIDGKDFDEGCKVEIWDGDDYVSDRTNIAEGVALLSGNGQRWIWTYEWGPRTGSFIPEVGRTYNLTVVKCDPIGGVCQYEAGRQTDPPVEFIVLVPHPQPTGLAEWTGSTFIPISVASNQEVISVAAEGRKVPTIADPTKWQLTLTRQGEQDIPGTNTRNVNGRAVFDLDLRGAAIGPWDIVLDHADGAHGTGAGALTITGAAHQLAVTSIDPASAYVPLRDTTDPTMMSLTVNGSAFALGSPSAPGSTVAVRRGEEALLVSNIAVLHSRQITCDVNLFGARVGDYEVTVGNPKPGISHPDPANRDDWDWSTTSATLSVVSPYGGPPTLTGIDPAEAPNDGVVSVTLSGGGFQPGATVALASAAESILGEQVQVVSPGSITCRFDLEGAKAQFYDVVVENLDWQSATLEDGFEVTESVVEPPPTPEIQSIDPRAARTGQVVTIRSILGRYFHPDAMVSLRRGGERVPAAGVTVNRWGTNITCQISLEDVPAGAWDVVVQNPDGPPGVLPGGFTVLPLTDEPPPEIAEWRILATHGGLGELATPMSDGYVEPRQGGIAELQVVFSEGMDPGTVGVGVVSIVTAGAGDISGGHVRRVFLEPDDDTVMRIHLSPALPNGQTYTFAVAGSVQDLSGMPLDANPDFDPDVVVNALRGDVNGDRTVSQDDLTALRARLGETVTASNAPYDLNLSGTLNAVDLLVVQDEMGKSVARARSPLQRIARLARECGRYASTATGAARDAAERSLRFVRGSWTRAVDAVRGTLS